MIKKPAKSLYLDQPHRKETRVRDCAHARYIGGQKMKRCKECMQVVSSVMHRKISSCCVGWQTLAKSFFATLHQSLESGELM